MRGALVIVFAATAVGGVGGTGRALRRFDVAMRTFDTAAPRGRGLTSMERRAVRLGGQLEVETSSGGSTVHLWMPIGGDAAVAPLTG